MYLYVLNWGVREKKRKDNNESTICWLNRSNEDGRKRTVSVLKLFRCKYMMYLIEKPHILEKGTNYETYRFRTAWMLH